MNSNTMFDINNKDDEEFNHIKHVLDDKIKEHFTKMSVFKGANKAIFASCSIPSYIRDWFLMRYEDKEYKGTRDT